MSNYSLSSLFEHFNLASWCIFAILISLSIYSWFIIYLKLVTSIMLHFELKRVLKKWRKLIGFGAISTYAEHDNSRLVNILVIGSFEWAKINMLKCSDIDKATLLYDVLNHELQSFKNDLFKGQSSLAIVASVSPFIGLLGTVIGIFYTMMDISAISNPTINVIAASVGETLFMTGFGLCVAIPAVFAYNIFNRFNNIKIYTISELVRCYHTLLVYRVKSDAI